MIVKMLLYIFPAQMFAEIVLLKVENKQNKFFHFKQGSYERINFVNRIRDNIFRNLGLWEYDVLFF